MINQSICQDVIVCSKLRQREAFLLVRHHFGHLGRHYKGCGILENLFHVPGVVGMYCWRAVACVVRTVVDKSLKAVISLMKEWNWRRKPSKMLLCSPLPDRSFSHLLLCYLNQRKNISSWALLGSGCQGGCVGRGEWFFGRGGKKLWKMVRMSECQNHLRSNDISKPL